MIFECQVIIQHCRPPSTERPILAIPFTLILPSQLQLYAFLLAHYAFFFNLPLRLIGTGFIFLFFAASIYESESTIDHHW
jgi:hypothetical protein